MKREMAFEVSSAIEGMENQLGNTGVAGPLPTD